MTVSQAQMQQERDDAKYARQLQQAEQGQVGAPVAVVAGIPVGPAPTRVGAAWGGGLPPPAVIACTLPVEEMTVLRYRFSLMCFATIDAFSTALNAVTAFVHAAQLNQIYHHHVMNEGLIGVFGLIFLIGPICGLIGANRLNQRLVAVYLAFCLAKTAFEILLAFVSPFLWYLIVAFIQLWITKIVCTFWSALRALTPEQKAHLLDPAASHDLRRMGFAYW